MPKSGKAQKGPKAAKASSVGAPVPPPPPSPLASHAAAREHLFHLRLAALGQSPYGEGDRVPAMTCLASLAASICSGFALWSTYPVLRPLLRSVINRRQSFPVLLTSSPLLSLPVAGGRKPECVYARFRREVPALLVPPVLRPPRRKWDEFREAMEHFTRAVLDPSYMQTGEAMLIPRGRSPSEFPASPMRPAVDPAVYGRLLTPSSRYNPKAWARAFTQWMREPDQEFQVVDPAFPLHHLVAARRAQRRKSQLKRASGHYDKDDIKALWTAFRQIATERFTHDLAPPPSPVS